jgi:hypothetical protein
MRKGRPGKIRGKRWAPPPRHQLAFLVIWYQCVGTGSMRCVYLILEIKHLCFEVGSCHYFQFSFSFKNEVRENISKCYLGEKYEKGKISQEKEERGKKKEERVKGKEKWDVKGFNKCKIEAKGHKRSQKIMCRERGEISISEREGGGGINIIFGSKCRPLE